MSLRRALLGLSFLVDGASCGVDRISPLKTERTPPPVENSQPSPPVTNVVEDVRACVETILAGEDMRFKILYATGKIPNTGTAPQISFAAEEGSKPMLISPLPADSPVIFRASPDVVDTSNPLNRVALTVEGNGKVTTFRFHERGSRPYAQDSRELEDCQAVDGYSDRVQLPDPPPPNCYCDEHGWECYIGDKSGQTCGCPNGYICDIIGGKGGGGAPGCACPTRSNG